LRRRQKGIRSGYLASAGTLNKRYATQTEKNILLTEIGGPSYAKRGGSGNYSEEKYER